MVKFNAHGPEGLIDRKPPGQPSKLTDTHRAALAARIDAGRGAGGAEEQDHPPLGETRHAPFSAQGPEDGVGLYLRRDLPGARPGRRPWSCPAAPPRA